MFEELQKQGLLTLLFTIVGMGFGAFLTFLTSWLLKSRETKLKISGQFIEKRIEAHEKILELAKAMRATISTDRVNVEGMQITYPIIFSSKEQYQNWRSSYFLITNQYSHWLGIEVTRELFFIQDYITNLDKRLEKAPDINYMQIGIILRNDFIDMATIIEKSVIKFFGKGWRNLKVEQPKGGHKYAKKITTKRLHELNLFTRHLELYKYLELEDSSIPRGDVKKNTELYNVAPNGTRIDLIKLREVPNIDNSGVEYEMSYHDYEDLGKPINFGHCELIGGKLMFDEVDREAQTIGIDYKAIKLLVKWIEENIEELYFEDETVEYE